MQISTDWKVSPSNGEGFTKPGSAWRLTVHRDSFDLNIQGGKSSCGNWWISPPSPGFYMNRERKRDSGGGGPLLAWDSSLFRAEAADVVFVVCIIQSMTPFSALPLTRR